MKKKTLKWLYYAGWVVFIGSAIFAFGNLIAHCATQP